MTAATTKTIIHAGDVFSNRQWLNQGRRCHPYGSLGIEAALSTWQNRGNDVAGLWHVVVGQWHDIFSREADARTFYAGLMARNGDGVDPYFSDPYLGLREMPRLYPHSDRRETARHEAHLRGLARQGARQAGHYAQKPALAAAFGIGGFGIGGQGSADKDRKNTHDR